MAFDSAGFPPPRPILIPATLAAGSFCCAATASFFSRGFRVLCSELRRRNVWAEDLRCVGDRWACRYLRAEQRAGRLRGPIVFVGHSCGGRYCLYGAHELQQADIPVDLVVCLDVALPPVPGNVKRAVNLYRSGPRLYPARPLIAAPGSSAEITNIELNAAGSPVNAQSPASPQYHRQPRRAGVRAGQNLGNTAGMVAVTRSEPFFTNKQEWKRDTSKTDEIRKRLPICCLTRINILVRFSGTVLAVTQGDPTDCGSVGRVLARLANGLPHRFAHGYPVRAEYARVVERFPHLSTHTVATLPVSECPNDASPIPLMPKPQVSDPPTKPSAPPRRASLLSRSLRRLSPGVNRITKTRKQENTKEKKTAPTTNRRLFLLSGAFSCFAAFVFSCFSFLRVGRHRSVERIERAAEDSIPGMQLDQLLPRTFAGTRQQHRPWSHEC